MGSNLTHTISGDIASFKSADTMPIESLKVNFLPVQEGSGDPSPSNVRVINGWTGLSLLHCNKNILDPSIRKDNSDGMIQSFGGNGQGATNGDLVLPAGTYTFSVNSPTGTIAIYKKGGAFITISQSTPATFTLNETTEIEILHVNSNVSYNYQLEVGPIATEYVPYNAQTISIDWTLTAGTLYGGYIDLVTGDVVATHKSITFTGAESEKWYDDTYSGYPRFWAVVDGAIQRTGRTYVLGNIGIYNANEHTEGTMFIYHSGSTLLYYYPPNTVTTVADFKTWLSSNNLQAVYELQTPIVVNTLTPVELKTFVGKNNLWSNANGNTAVTYEFTDYLKKKAMSLYNPDFIPPAYKKYDYLQTSGGKSRIDTGVSGDDTTLQIETEFKCMAMNENYAPLFGNYQSETANKIWRVILPKLESYPNNDLLYVTCGNVAPSGTYGGTKGIRPCGTGNSIIGQKIYLKITYGSCYYKGTISNTVTSTTTNVAANTKTISLGSISPTTNSYTSPFRIYSFKMYSHGKIIRNYIPTIRLSDNKAGFFDTINGTFNPSIGSVEFVAGNEE